MIKNITLSGLSTTPSSHECQDGEIAAMLNLVPEDGALKPLHEPYPVGSLDEGDMLWVHETPDYLHYIKFRGSDKTWWWANEDVFKNEDAPVRRNARAAGQTVITITLQQFGEGQGVRIYANNRVAEPFSVTLKGADGSTIVIDVSTEQMSSGWCDIHMDIAATTYTILSTTGAYEFRLQDSRPQPSDPSDPDKPSAPTTPEIPEIPEEKDGAWTKISGIIGDTVKDVSYTGNVLVIATAEYPVQYVVWNASSINGYNYLGLTPRIDIDFALQGDIVSKRYKNVLRSEKAAAAGEGGFYDDKLYEHTTKGSNLDGHMYMTTETWEDLCSVGVREGKTYRVKRATSGSDDSWYLKVEHHQADGGIKNVAYLRSGNSYVKIEIESGDYLKLGSTRSSTWHTGKITYEIWGKSDDSTDSEYYIDADNIDGFTAVYGVISDYMRYYGEEKGKFIDPFFVRYSIKLYDGTSLFSSAPLLMMPNSGLAPKLLATHDATLDDNNTTVYAWAFACDLVYRIRNTEEIAKWKNVITGVSIEISRPISRLKADAQWIKGVRKVKCKYYDYNEDVSKRTNVNIPEYGLMIDGEKSLNKEIIKDSPNIPFEFVIEPPLKGDGEYLKSLLDTTAFYRILELKAEEIFYEDGSAGAGWSAVPTDTTNVIYPETGIEVKYDSLATNHLYAEKLLSYNGRMHMINVREDVSSAGSGLSPIIYKYAQGDITHKWCMRIKSMKNGQTYETITDWRYGDPLQARWFFSQDPDVKEVIIYEWDGYETSARKATLKATPHELISGSYAFSLSSMEFSDGYAPTEEEIDSLKNIIIPHKNEIYVSEVNNPFVYPAANAVQCGRGEVLGVAANTETVSEGQFGEAPLYAFTSEESWVLSLSNSGVYNTKQALTNIVCINPKYICSLDNAVVFTTVNGIMLVQGKNVQCISDQLRDQVSKYTLPHLHDIMQACNINKDSDYLPDYSYDSDWLTFLKTCKIVHDKVNNRIIVSPQDSDISYVYSLRSGLWGMQGLSISGAINKANRSWIRNGNMIYDLSNPEDCKSNEKRYPAQYVITRPMGIEESDAFKRIKAMIVRGYFRKHHLACALYGSRDLFNWRLIHTSKDHYLRGISGTPYKYFIAVIPASLVDDESMQGLSFEFDYIMTNQVR